MSAVAWAGGPSIVMLPTVGNYGCGENQSGNTLNIGTPNANVTAGDTLVVLISGPNPGATVTSISNGQGAGGDVWKQVPGVYGSDFNGGVEDIWIASDVNGATNGASVTINTSAGNSFVGACMFEVSGLDVSDPVDQAASAETNTLATTLLSAAIGGTVQPELILAVSACAYTGADTAPVGGITFNAIDGGAGADGVGGCPAGYLITSTTGSFQAGLVQSPAGTGVVGIVSLKARPAGFILRWHNS
jgi:hypothetical protein